MAKTHGLGARLFVAGVNMSGDVGSLQAIGGGLAGTQDMTGIDKLAFERGGLLRDGRIEYTALFNPEGAHPTLSALPTADQPVTYANRNELGAPAASMVAKQIGYDPTRAADGSLTIAVQAVANGNGLEWGVLLSSGAETHESDGENGTGLDYGATIGETDFGLQAWLHVLDLDGDTITVSIEDSANGSDWTAVGDAAFAAVTTTPASQRLQTGRAATARQHLRVASTGTFTSATFVVAVAKNVVEVLF